MAAGCVRWALCHAARRAWPGGVPGLWAPASRLPGGSGLTSAPCGWSPLCTAAGDAAEAPAPQKKTKADPRARPSISSVGRKIPDRLLQVTGEDGESLGVMHRADVLKIMDERNLKLVLLSAGADPPLYRLMSGRQVHQEQIKLREQQKARAAPVQVKELSLTAGIAAHDLHTKLRQVKSWLEKRHHVRVTLRAARGQAGDLELKLEQMLERAEAPLGFVSKPKSVRDGQAAVCVVRPPSAKELAKKEKPQQDRAAPAQREAPPAGEADPTQGTVQQ